MNHPWIIFFLLGIAAAFLPLQFGYEIYLFGQENGPRKTGEFVAGITLFRVLLLFVIGLFFVGITIFLARMIVDLATFVQTLFAIFNGAVVSGQLAFLDVLLIICGFLLLVEALVTHRRSKKVTPVEEAEKKIEEKPRFSPFLLGFFWISISINQWLFILAGANQILVVTNDITSRFLLSLFFLLLASSLILTPFIIYLLWPQRVNEKLAAINHTINSSMTYIIMALLIAGGLYLIVMGGRGLQSYLAGP